MALPTILFEGQSVDCGKVPSTDFIMKELREDIDI
jgi:hypothetical protein